MPLSKLVRRTVQEESKLLGDFIETLPIKLFATLTLPFDSSLPKIEGLFLQWVAVLQTQHRLTLGWVYSIEPHPRKHVHALIVAHGSLDATQATALWRQLAATRFKDAARVVAYRGGARGAAYTLKQLDWNRENIRFSENLSAFGSENGTRFFRRCAAERRQMRRIRAQKVVLKPLRAGT